MSGVRKHVLFVCTGNTCRSPMARRLFERRAREAGLPWTADCAGTAGVKGHPMTDEAKRALEARGITDIRHQSKVLSAELVRAADHIYAMTREHMSGAVYLFPEAKGKISVLREDAGLTHPDIDDPIGHPQAAYEACARQIDEALEIIIRRHSNAHSR